MANVLFNASKSYLLNGSVDLDTDTIKVMLVTSSYVPNIDTHAFRSDVTNEVTGTGYSAGGQALVSKTVTVDTVNDRAVFDAADVTWASSTITARAGVLYKSRGGAASADELVGYVDFNTDITSTNGNFQIIWNANGILYLS